MYVCLFVFRTVLPAKLPIAPTVNTPGACRVPIMDRMDLHDEIAVSPANFPASPTIGLRYIESPTTRAALVFTPTGRTFTPAMPLMESPLYGNNAVALSTRCHAGPPFAPISSMLISTSIPLPLTTPL